MLIDWFTVIAQIANFFILVWLLKRFLYKPILKAIDDREKLIASRIAEAEKKEADAKQSSDEFLKKNREFDSQKSARMKEVDAESEAERQRLLEQARQDAASLKLKLERAVEEERARLSKEIISRTQSEVFALADKVLKEIANLSLQEQVVQVFVSRLESINGKEKDNLLSAFGEAKEPLVVRSVFDLNESEKLRLQETLARVLSGKVSLKFETSQSLVAGIELSGAGYKMSWSIADHLASLQKELEKLIRSKERINLTESQSSEDDRK
ncbi:MAG: F0F1 ATP synthase subunit B [Bacteroidetes bacterium]|nr:F0F1 ATP synthase subunit B [Bacteroidota bacterium]